MDEPTAVLNYALQQLVQSQQGVQQQPTAAKQQDVPAFLPADRFQGAKQGYYFGSGEHGTGYYRDALQPLEVEEAAARPRHDAQELLRQAEEQADASEMQLLDEKSLRKMLNAFEKKAKENLELRMKHGDDPMKFLDNEVDLMSIIRGLAQVAADPNTLYPLLVDSPAVSSLAGLLSHDNTDIAMEVLDLMQELTDADEEEDNRDVAGSLVDALLEANALELLVERLGKLNEAVDEEAAAVNHALAVIEHAVELRPAQAVSLLERTKLLKWLLQRIRVRASDSNKQYASEILSILMQGHEANQRLLCQANGIDTLLVCLAGFKSKEPADAEEQEFMENLFDCLCSCLLLPANRAAFVECEGVELMHLLLKGKKSSRYGAIKTIDFATTRSPSACDRLVDAGALAQLFAIFMGRSKIKNSKGEASDREVAKEVEERCVSIISNLFQGVTKNSRKERLAAKFVEAEFEKVDRLMEVCFRYEGSVRACEARLARQAEEEGQEVDEEELLLERMDAGLFTLQCGMVVVAALWSTGDAGLRKRLLACLHQKGQSLAMVRSYLREFYFSLGDDGALEEKQRQLQRLAQLLTALGVDIAAEAAERHAAAGGAAGAAAAAAAEGEQPAEAGEAKVDEDMDLEPEGPGTSRQPAAQHDEAARPAEQQQQGNGVSSSSAKGEPPEQQQQRVRAAVPGKPPSASGDRAAAKKPESSDRRRSRSRSRERSRRERSRSRERERAKDKDRGSRRSRSPDRHSRRRNRSRDRDEAGAAHKSSSSRQKRRRRSHSRSRSRSR